jgi:predicted secreted protein
MKRLIYISLSLLLLLILIPGCSPSATIIPVGTPAVIREFSSTPSTINSGGISTLLWNVTGATSVSIDQGIGQVDTAGTREVSPGTSTVYTISATNATGTVTRSAVTTVNSVTPVIIEFSNNPATIDSGGTSTLMWNVTGATSVSIDQGIGQVAVAGTRVVSPATSTVYTISATNSAGMVIRSSTIITVSVVPQTTASNPVISFTANSLGGTSWQLNWNVSNATQIVIQPDIGPVNPTGSAVVTVPSGQTKLYRLEAINDWGWAYWQVIMVTP